MYNYYENDEFNQSNDWLYQFLLNASPDEDSDCLEPNFIKVLRHVDGPFEDGSVRKQVSDGDQFMDALFSWEAIQSGILCDDSQMEWDRCTLLLKRYRVRYEMPSAVDQNYEGQMILVVNKCDLVALDLGFPLDETPSSCTTHPELRKRLQSYYQNVRPVETSIGAESTSPVSPLMAQTLEDGMTCTYQMPPFDRNNFQISAEDQLRLDAFEEWFSDSFPFEETPTVHSDVALHEDLSSEVHCQTAPPLPTNHPKILCDASVQVTLCQHDWRIRPVEAAVQVGSSLLFNAQKSIRRTDNSCSQESRLPVAFPCSGLPFPIQASCVQDFRLREETWSSSSSLHLSCDEEPDDPQLDPSQKMLQSRLPSSDPTENMTLEVDSPLSLTAFKMAAPSSSRSTILSSPSTWKIQLEESTDDPVTTGILHCTDPERLNPISRSGSNFRCIQSTQIGDLSSQYCLIEPDFPLSPERRLEEIGCRSQSSEPFTFETIPVGDRKTDESRVSELGCAGTYPRVIARPTEALESEETEIDSFDEHLINSATLLQSELEPPPSPPPSPPLPHSVVDPGADSAHRLPLMHISTHKTATGKNDEVITSYEKQKSAERKNQKSLTRAKGSKRLLSQRRDPMALFAKPIPRKRPNNCKRKLFNIDQKLEGISSDIQTDDDSINNTRFHNASEKQQKTVHNASDEKKRPKGDSCMSSGRKSKKTGTGEKVDMIARVMLEPLSSGGQFGKTNSVANIRSGQKTLSHEVVKERSCSGKKQMKKSKIGVTGVTNSTFDGEELGRAVGFKCIQRYRSELQLINCVAVEDTAKDGDGVAVDVNNVYTVPSEFTFAEADRECNMKTGAMLSSSDNICEFSEVHGWDVATDKVHHRGKLWHARNCSSFVDTFPGITKKSNNLQEMYEDTGNPQFSIHGVSGGTGSHDRSGTWSYDRDTGTSIDVNAISMSRDSTVRKSPHSERSHHLKRNVSNRDVVGAENRRTAAGDTTSHSRETVKDYASSDELKCRSTSMLKGSSKSDDNSQDPKIQTLPPTPKNSLPSHQPQKQSVVPHDSHLLSPVNSKPSSPKFNRDQIKMLIGRDEADEARALLSFDPPEDLKRWTYDYFKNWPS